MIIIALMNVSREILRQPIPGIYRSISVPGGGGGGGGGGGAPGWPI